MFWASIIAQLLKNLPAMQESPVQLLSWKDPLKRDRLPTPIFLGFPCASASREPTCNVGDMGSIPGLGRSPGEGKGYPLQYSDLENSSPWGCKELDMTEWLKKKKKNISFSELIPFIHILLHSFQVLLQRTLCHLIPTQILWYQSKNSNYYHCNL